MADNSEKKPDRVFLSPPHMGGREMDYVREAFASNFIAPLGPQVDAFESEFCERTGFAHALALSSGTAAIHLALRVLGVGAGHVVAASTLTFIGSVTPVVFLGATPVFVDSDEATWNLDPVLLESALKTLDRGGRLPKAVLPTDLYGQPADLDAISDICEPYGIPVIADAAESLGAEYKGRAPGRGAYAACYSFNGNKIITTSGGGMLASDDREFIARARFLSQQAREPAAHYEHHEIGYNYRMSNLLAAVGRGQLKILEERVAARRRIFDFYREHLGDLPGIGFMPEAPDARHSRWLTVIKMDKDRFGADPAMVMEALEAENIESRPVWKPMHLQPVFRTDKGADPGAGVVFKDVPARVFGGAVSEKFFETGLCLPSGSAMGEADLIRVVEIIRGCREKQGVASVQKKSGEN